MKVIVLETSEISYSEMFKEDMKRIFAIFVRKKEEIMKRRCQHLLYNLKLILTMRTIEE
jgi:hypothetical protein